MNLDDVAGRHRQLQSFVVDLVARESAGRAEARELVDLVGRSADVQRALRDGGDPRRLECEQLRPFALRLRRFALRGHPMVIEPVWGATTIRRDPNALFFAGSDEHREALELLCAERGLRLVGAAPTHRTAESRWRPLRESAAVVVEFGRSPTERASACHTIGIALVLGNVPVVLCERGRKLPFGLGLEPVDADGLRAAVDRALYRVPKSVDTGSLARTAATMGLELGTDPIEARHALEERLAETQALVYPVWPAYYPDPNEPRCFHVAPFAASDDIWTELCRASSVVVDISDLDENGCLALGIVQTLGRPVLVVAHEEPPLFPAIAEVRCEIYRDDAGLEALVQAFRDR